ncbi:hypothetical protein Nepgr_025440 [Nepenthes gracilis]|uniref:Uncharacterized protein n=1 Tax=Nepenthes gracilis TaxID=150966 RepID=A0AAD3T7T6_NEPGR|nr:hypothetical protein Nepgr_025440 [Nepenthes gracilis]
MAIVDDDAKECSVSSPLVDFSKKGKDTFTPEDVAWVNSCFVDNYEASDSNCNFLTDALLENLNLQPQITISYASDNGILASDEKIEAAEYSVLTGGDFMEDEVEGTQSEAWSKIPENLQPQITISKASDNETLPSDEKIKAAEYCVSTGEDLIEDDVEGTRSEAWSKILEKLSFHHYIGDNPVEIGLFGAGSEVNNDSALLADNIGCAALTKNHLMNAFQPNYNDEMPGTETSDLGLDMGLSFYELELSSDQIFKVWDLGISDEEDDFTKQLNKALSESSSQTVRATSEDESLDGLIAGISDLSLSQNSD